MTRFSLSKCRPVACAVAAALLIGAATYAADSAQTDFQRNLDAAMDTLSQKYEDVKNEFDEEYRAISRQKDDDCNAIYEKINTIRELRTNRSAAMAKDEEKLREDFAAAGIDPKSLEYTTAIASLEAREKQMDESYQHSLTTLRQLYHLNGKRFNELLKINNSREQIEENRMREERDLLANRLRLEARRESPSLTEVEKNALATRLGSIAEIEQEGRNVYENALAALDKYKSLVGSRMAAQRTYFDEQNSLMQDLIQDKPGADYLASFSKRLSALNDKKESEERLYQNSANFVEEKIALERQRAREFSPLAKDKRDVTRAWFKKEYDSRQYLDSLSSRLKSGLLTKEQGAQLQDQITSAKTQLSEAGKSYKSALDNIAGRRSVMQGALDERMTYLEDRNDLRHRMGETALSKAELDRYRSEIGKLEDRRIDTERKANGNIASLRQTMPTEFTGTPWTLQDIETRTNRVNEQYEKMVARIQDAWNPHDVSFQSSLSAFDKHLANSSLIGEQRRTVVKEREQTEKDYTATKQRYENAIRLINERHEAEKDLLLERADYLAKRNELKSSLSLEKADYLKIGAFDKEMRNLDNRMLEMEKKYRNAVQQPANALLREFEGATKTDGLRIQDRAVRETAARESKPATEKRAVDNTGEGEEIDTVRDVYERAKEAVVDTYHDTMRYLAD